LPARCSFTCGKGPVASPEAALDACDAGVVPACGEAADAGALAVGWRIGLLSPPPLQALSKPTRSTAAKIRIAINIHDAG
jgi:hypothetical protein